MALMDLSLDLNPASPNFGDLLIINGDFVGTSDADPRGTNYVLQDIVQRLSLYKGEWFLNTTLGVPYLQQILVKNPDLAIVDTIIQNTITGTPGVQQLTSYKLTLGTGPTARCAYVKFTAQTVAGPVEYDGPLNLPTSQVSQ